MKPFIQYDEGRHVNSSLIVTVVMGEDEVDAEGNLGPTSLTLELSTSIFDGDKGSIDSVTITDYELVQKAIKDLEL